MASAVFPNPPAEGRKAAVRTGAGAGALDSSSMGEALEEVRNVSRHGGVMKEHIKALLVQARPDPLDALRLALEEQSVNIYTARNCAEAALALWSDRPPHLVFTEIQLSDGNWADILTLVSKASEPVNVIVMAPFADVNFYIQAIERGAFDFIVPPLSDPELLHVVSIAAENALTRRRQHAALLEHRLFSNPQNGHLENEPAVTGAED